ncbi:MAG: methylenetetrahydrofolate reductase [NAD(P)H] [Lachnospiraceae bacterium]|jgi:methylenetetrahydrofolate reductase (NADPH)
MKISEILSSKDITISMEVFPPKTMDNYEKVSRAANAIASYRPDFMSITYGAGGGTSEQTLNIAREIRDRQNVETLCHLTCVSSTQEKVHSQLEKMKEYGLENVMALRGDLPADGTAVLSDHYRHASELIEEIRQAGDFCIGGACYPEAHPESASRKEDLRYLKEKQDAGCDFFTTQMFFDNSAMYSFMYRAREAGITVPIVAGIMPLTSVKQVERSQAMSGTFFPAQFRTIVDRYGSSRRAFAEAGIAYATEQIVDLIANDITHIHIYTMNHPKTAREILNRLMYILGRGDLGPAGADGGAPAGTPENPEE